MNKKELKELITISKKLVNIIEKYEKTPLKKEGGRKTSHKKELKGGRAPVRNEYGGPNPDPDTPIPYDRSRITDHDDYIDFDFNNLTPKDYRPDLGGTPHLYKDWNLYNYILDPTQDYPWVNATLRQHNFPFQITYEDFLKYQPGYTDYE